MTNPLSQNGDWPAVSVVTPVWREALSITALVNHLARLRYPGPLEFLVVDGAPEADTLSALKNLDPSELEVKLLRSDPGRARQMNAGAAQATGEILLFLHADTRLPETGLEAVVRLLATRPDPSSEFVAGAFRLRLDSQKPLIRLCQWVGNLRNTLTRTPYGDQAQFFRAQVFRELGGYADIPLMEDVEIMRRLRRAGRRIRILPLPALTSARRFEEEGALRTGFRNSLLRLLFGLGVPAEKLDRFYKQRKHHE